MREVLREDLEIGEDQEEDVEIGETRIEEERIEEESKAV